EFERVWKGWQERGVAILGGNAMVKNDVGAGRHAFGLTDTDDAFGARDEGMPVGVLYPDEGLLIPNTISLIRGAPHAEAGRRLIDYLLRPETERMLANSRSGQIPLRANVPRPQGIPLPDAVHSLPVDWTRVAAQAEECADAAQQLMKR
ncbi:MAG: extracellular solute-binding protein, partial [Candidatus Sumerlaeota bacterium]|nr:extracellular solute-binding protein [Candidatus Sumerlaeota bacterium]